jgi:hypothetical protein
MQTNGLTVQSSSADQFKYTMQQLRSQHQMDRLQYPTGRK